MRDAGPRVRLPRYEAGLTAAVVGFTLVTLVFFQGPFLASVMGHLHITGPQDLLLLLSTQVIQFLLMCTILFLVSIFSIRLMKLVMGLMLVTNAAALYFMNAYGVVYDTTMIGNVLNTDGTEAAALWSPMLAAYLLPAIGATLAGWIILHLRKPRLPWRIAGFVTSAALLVGWIFATPQTWFWYDRNGGPFGSRLLPWSYIVNTARYTNQYALANRHQILMPKGHFLADPPPGTKDVVVLVIGEAARADRFSNYGFGRETNPYTPKTDIAVLPMGDSCATYTIAALACMLTEKGNAASPRTDLEPIQSYMTRMGVYTVWRTNNFGEPPVKVDQYIHRADIAKDCKGADCPDRGRDEALFWHLPQLIESIDNNRIFITLHEHGSHGPSYYDNYPKAFEAFKPVCDTVEVAKCSTRDLRNAYDNTLVYSDYLLAKLVRDLSAVPNARIAMIYLSDHGESLGENGLYLHGAPIAVAPPAQRLVPFYVWMSDSFKKSRGLTNADVMRPSTKPDNLVFHSIMGAFGLVSDAYNPDRDVFRKGPAKLADR